MLVNQLTSPPTAGTTSMDWQRLSELMFVPPIACVVFPRACLRYFPLCEMYYNCLCVHWCILFEMVGYRQYCGFFGAGEELSTSGIRTSCAVHPLKMYSRCMIDNLWLIIILLLWRVPEFEASKYLVSNREFYEFVKDGGYQRKELWTEEGKWDYFSTAMGKIYYCRNKIFVPYN